MLAAVCITTPLHTHTYSLMPSGTTETRYLNHDVPCPLITVSTPVDPHTHTTTYPYGWMYPYRPSLPRARSPNAQARLVLRAGTSGPPAA